MEPTQTKTQTSNKSLIYSIGGAIIAFVVLVLGLVISSVGSTKSNPCTGKDPDNGKVVSGYRDGDKCKTLDGKELK